MCLQLYKSEEKNHHLCKLTSAKEKEGNIFLDILHIENSGSLSPCSTKETSFTMPFQIHHSGLKSFLKADQVPEELRCNTMGISLDSEAETKYRQ